MGNARAGERIAPADITFETMLDETCERLRDRQVKYAVQRLYELEKRLGSLEHELDEFLQTRK